MALFNRFFQGLWGKTVFHDCQAINHNGPLLCGPYLYYLFLYGYYIECYTDRISLFTRCFEFKMGENKSGFRNKKTLCDEIRRGGHKRFFKIPFYPFDCVLFMKDEMTAFTDIFMRTYPKDCSMAEKPFLRLSSLLSWASFVLPCLIFLIKRSLIIIG